MATLQRITPCLWFDNQAEEAVAFYTGIFRRSRVRSITRYGESGSEIHGRSPGSVMTIGFDLTGQRFTAINGGPAFRFSEALSLQVHCDTQAELDYYWTQLGDGGNPDAQKCGWLKDRFGVSWQIVPSELPELLQDHRRGNAVMQALLAMKKLDIVALRRSFHDA